MGELGKEEAKGRDILEARSCLETGVQVDADALGMREGLNTLGIVRTNASTQ